MDLIQKYPAIVHGHRTTWHDGCVAMLLPDCSKPWIVLTVTNTN